MHSVVGQMLLDNVHFHSNTKSALCMQYIIIGQMNNKTAWQHNTKNRRCAPLHNHVERQQIDNDILTIPKVITITATATHHGSNLANIWLGQNRQT